MKSSETWGLEPIINPKQFKINLSNEGELSVETPVPLKEGELQTLVDAASLNQKYFLTHERESRRAQQTYVLVALSLLFFSVFTVTVATVRTYRFSQANQATTQTPVQTQTQTQNLEVQYAR